MIHKFKRHEAGYLVLSKDCLEDPNLSWKAKGLHAYLISLPSNWFINIADLANRSTDGRIATARAVDELIEAGYITREQTRDENGRVGKSIYEAYEVPYQRMKEIPYTEEEFRFKFAVRTKTAHGFPAHGKPATTKETKNTKDTSQEASENEVKIRGWNKMVYGLWVSKMGGPPNKGGLQPIKEVCMMHGLDAVRKALEYYLAHEDKRFASLRSFASKFGMWVERSGGSLGGCGPDKPQDATRYEMPSRQ